MIKRPIYFTPGPSELYPTVPTHLQRALEEKILSISHRGETFQNIFFDAQNGLKRLFSIPEGYQVFFLSSATEAMERILQNCVDKKSFHVETGAFGKKFFTLAEQLGKDASEYAIDPAQPVSLKQMVIPKHTELVAFTQTETTTGFSFPLDFVYRLKKEHPNVLFCLDVVSAVPYVEIDFKYIDLAFFSVQKGFGLPSGLGVIIISPQALEKALFLEKEKRMVGTYHRFSSLLSSAKKGQTPETPNVFGLYLFKQVVSDMNTRGIGIIRRETEEKANMLYKSFHANGFSPLVSNALFQSKTVAVIKTDQSEALRKFLTKQGFVVGSGYGQNKNSQTRIANFPSHALFDMSRLIFALSEFSKN